MAKPRVYGIGMRATSPKMMAHLERCFWAPARQQLLQRQREKTTRKPVATQIVNEKEAAGK